MNRFPTNNQSRYGCPQICFNRFKVTDLRFYVTQWLATRLSCSLCTAAPSLRKIRRRGDFFGRGGGDCTLLSQSSKNRLSASLASHAKRLSSKDNGFSPSTEVPGSQRNQHRNAEKVEFCHLLTQIEKKRLSLNTHFTVSARNSLFN